MYQIVLFRYRLPSASLRTVRRATSMAVLLLSGCAVPDLGPAPVIRPPSAYAAERSLAPDRPDGVWPEAAWWTMFRDAQLDGLMQEAFADSPDLAVADARVRRAAAYVQEIGAERLPTASLQGGMTLTKQSYNNGIPSAFVPHGWNDTGRLEADLGFDLDLWGRNKAAYGAARSEAEAARLDGAQAMLTLSTEIAEAYSDFARLHAERDVQVVALDVRLQTEALTAERVGSGLDTQAELKQARSAVPAARADLAATDEQISLSRNRMAALLGQGPDRGLGIMRPKASVARRDLPSDLTTNLIGRRPDIIAARVRVEAEASRIKVARADFYPSINLSAVIGLQALGLGNLFKGASTSGSAGPALSLPLFRGGELQGRYRGARASFDEAVANYDRAVTDAYRAVADAVASRRSVDVQLAEQRRSLDQAQEAYGVARLRYEGGLSRFLDVLSAQDRALKSQRIVADLQSRIFTLDVALVRALGGGFLAAPPAGPSRITKDLRNG